MFGFTDPKTRDDIEKDLALYKRERKLEIDEEISTWRRTQKNRALEGVMKRVEETRVNLANFFDKEQKAELEFAEKTAAKAAEIAKLDAAIEAKAALATQKDSDFEARAQLRERTSKAEREKFDAVIAEKDVSLKTLASENAYLRSIVDKFLSGGADTIKEAVKSLGEAASQDHSTKVVGLGVTAFNAEKKNG